MLSPDRGPLPQPSVALHREVGTPQGQVSANPVPLLLNPRMRADEPSSGRGPTTRQSHKPIQMLKMIKPNPTIFVEANTDPRGGF